MISTVQERSTPVTTRADYARLQQERIQQLRERAADRPQHAAFLEVLLALPNPIQVLEQPNPDDLGERVSEALRLDVDYCRAPLPEDLKDGALGINQLAKQYPNAYQERRSSDARAADKRRAIRKRPPVLDALLRLDGT
jgi:hypothetical protein